MSAIEQRARELLAAEYEADGCTQLAHMIRSGDVTDPDFGSVKIMRSMRAIIAALTCPEGLALVPVVPTQEMHTAWMCSEGGWADRYKAMLAARPEVTGG